MIALFKLLTGLFMSLAILMFGSGFFTSFVSLRLDLSRVSSTMIGFITASFYVGVLLASFLIPFWIRKLGHLRLWILLCAINCILVLTYFLWMNPLFWLFIRCLSGIVMGGFYIVIESWLLLLSPSTKRSLCLAMYVITLYTATSLGQLLLQVYDLYSWTPYGITGALSLLAILPCLSCRVPIPSYTQPSPVSFRLMVKGSFTSFFVGAVSGAILGCVYGLAPVYGHDTEQSISRISIMMTMIVLGGVFLQLPLGKWADLYSRSKVVVITCGMAGLLSLLVRMYGATLWPESLALFFLFGGFSFALYPLALALACDQAPDHRIVTITGGINIMYGVGAIIGPMIAPWFMMWRGAGGLFDFMAILCCIACVVGLSRMRKTLV